MNRARKIKEDLYWIGGNDRRLELFENVFPVPRGISYNSYLLLDEKAVLLDAVDQAISTIFFDNLAQLLAGRSLDYVVINHMEPDHCATLGELILRYPSVKIVGNQKTMTMIRQFFNIADLEQRTHLVTEGDTLCTGTHSLSFYMAPMVHWPEVMVTYDSLTKTLFSADAFGTFGAMAGNLFADEMEFERDWLADARSYYANIVGKYGTQVNALLNKAATLDIEMICPLHGPLWRANISWYLDKYRQWASYQPEEKAVMIAYASVYGNTAGAADLLAARLAEAGVRNIAMYDVSKTHPSVIVAEAFRCSHLVFASTTYNAGIFFNMEALLLDLKEHNLQNRTVALIENGSWAPTSGKLMRDLFASMKNINVLEQTLSLRSSLKDDQLVCIDEMAAAIVESMALPVAGAPVSEKLLDANALFKLSYGLFVLSARDGARDAGCIVNTVMQATDNPKRVLVGVNKQNYTHEIISKTGEFAVSILSESVPFAMFQRFGFQCGRSVDKFAGLEGVAHAENGVAYLTKHANAVICGKVVEQMDLGTHTIFVADVTEAHILSEEPSVTYTYYFDHIKPKPQPAAEHKKGYVCKICGYVYEGDTLPDDFICPLCKHGAEDFEPLP